MLTKKDDENHFPHPRKPENIEQILTKEFLNLLVNFSRMKSYEFPTDVLRELGIGQFSDRRYIQYMRVDYLA